MQELPKAHKVVLWVGIAMDVFSKASMAIELCKFARRGNWAWFSMILVFFLLSSAVVTVYWLSHYPGDLDQKVHLQRTRSKVTAPSPEPQSGPSKGKLLLGATIRKGY